MKRENTFQTIYIFEKICSGRLENTLWRDLLWPFDQYHCTFLYTSNFGWSMSQMRQWVGELCFEQGFTEKCDLTFYFFIWIKVTSHPLSIQIIWKKLNPDWVREHKIYSEHVILILERLIAISHLQTRAILSWGPCMGLSSLPNIMLPYKDNNTHVNRDQP